MASVLVVDEQPGTREWLMRVLLVDGHDPVEGCRGADALDRAERLRPDLVIAGTGPPDVDGLEVVQTLRVESGLEGVPVILLSEGHAGQVLEMVASADGAVFVVHGQADEVSVREAVKVALSLPNASSRADAAVARSHDGCDSDFPGARGDQGLFREAFEALPDALVVLESGRICHANAMADRTFGYAPGALAGRDVCDLLPGLSPDLDPTAVNREAAARLELEGRRRGGEPFPASVRRSRFRAEDREWAILVVCDLTEPRQRELQAGVALRHEATGRLAGGLAHEFNNMLTVITGYAAMGQDLVTPLHPVHQPLEEVLAAAERASRITARLEAFSRRRVQSPETFDVDRTLTDLEPSGCGETILLVEDEDSVRVLVAHLLRGWGYEVLQASNGPEGLSASAGYDGLIHLVLTDIVMPQMSGLEMGERILAQRPSTKILYMSGYSDVRLPPGAPFLSKPFSPVVLSARVRSLLDAPPETRGHHTGF